MPVRALSADHPTLIGCLRCRHLGLVLLLALAGCDVSGRGECTLRQVAELPVGAGDRVPVIEAELDDHPEAFVVDSGAGRSMIDPATIRALHLPVWDGEAVRMRDLNAVVRVPLVHVDRVTIGTATDRHATFGETGGDDRVGAGGARTNLVGDDLLSRYDVEFDLPHGRIGLFTEEGDCRPDFTPYDAPVAAVPIGTAGGDGPVLTGSLDGHAVFFLLDSGSPHTLITPGTAAEIGVPADATQVDPRTTLRGAEGGSETAIVHRFASLAVGSDVSAPAPVEIGTAPSNLLGSDWLRTHRVWLSFAQRELLIVR